MHERWTEQLLTHENSAPDNDGDMSFCPECSQSLDLSRLGHVPARHRALEAYIFAIVGLIVVAMFGVNAWYAHRSLVNIDQQMEDSGVGIAEGAWGWGSDGETALAVTIRLPLQRTFDRDMVGLALGAVTTILGVGTLIRQRRERLGRVGHVHRGMLVKVTLNLWDFGDSVVRPLLWTVVMLCGGMIVADVIRGEPLTLDLLDRALERTVEIIVTISGTLL